MTNNLNKEKQEAIEAGQRALSSLRDAQNELSSAENWGLFDMFGGGFLSTLAKHNEMDSAQAYIAQAKEDLDAFRKELQDVGTAADIQVCTDGFLSFADYFFDGFLTDLLVQEQINEASSQVKEAIQRVEEVLAQLQKN